MRVASFCLEVQSPRVGESSGLSEWHGAPPRKKESSLLIPIRGSPELSQEKNFFIWGWGATLVVLMSDFWV